MLQCAPNIIDILEDDAVLVEQILQPSPHKTKGIRETDVDSVKEKCDQPTMKISSLCTENNKIVPHLNEIMKIRPDSPDIIRAAKQFEQACLTQESETIQKSEDNSSVTSSFENNLRARSKTNR